MTQLQLITNPIESAIKNIDEKKLEMISDLRGIIAILEEVEKDSRYKGLIGPSNAKILLEADVKRILDNRIPRLAGIHKRPTQDELQKAIEGLGDLKNIPSKSFVGALTSTVRNLEDVLAIPIAIGLGLAFITFCSLLGF